MPTLLSRDGVHPSAPERFQGDYSEEALRSHGYNLRNALVLMAYAEVLEALAAPRPAAGPAVEVPHRPWFPQAPPLPPPAGEVIRVGDVDGLHAASRRVKPGGTILLADGVYPVTRTVVIATDRVTLRGESGRRQRVVLDGGGTLGELLTLRACSGVTIADLTVRNVRWNGIKLDTDTGRAAGDHPQLHPAQHLAARDQGGEGPGGGARDDPAARLPHRVLPLRERPPQAVRGRPRRHAAATSTATTSAAST